MHLLAKAYVFEEERDGSGTARYTRRALIPFCEVDPARHTE